MALKGIESQVIMQRTGEYMRDSAVAQRRGEMNIAAAAQETRTETERFAEQIAQVQQKEENEVRNDLENDSGNAYEPTMNKKKKRKQKDEKDNEPNVVAADEDHMIDIRV